MKQMIVILTAMFICIAVPALAQTNDNTAQITQEEIERLFIDEVKLPGKMLQCYQTGQEIIHEVGLQSFEQAPGRITAKRLDGSMFEVLLEGADIACTIITRDDE